MRSRRHEPWGGDRCSIISTARTSLAWEAEYATEESELLGDAFAYGIEPNRPTLETIIRYGAEQGFCDKGLLPEDLFFETTRTRARI